MLRVSVLYPPSDRFDIEYFANTHMKMVAEKCGAALVRSEVDKGIQGAMPGSPAPYVAAAHMYFNSLAEFGAAFAPHAGAIMADMPNYTDSRPTVQISEIVEA
jgi:uncharacterized protein (TIGR02118 family)